MIRCFLVIATGNERSVEKKCSCRQPACQGTYTTTEREWKRTDTGEIRWGWPSEFGIGAMYFANCQLWDNDSGEHLIVITPGGAWDVDSRARNCTLKDDRLHRCWIRHGEPPNVTVDKNGVTCGAGSGSILAGDYHGFLREGCLT